MHEEANEMDLLITLLQTIAIAILLNIAYVRITRKRSKPNGLPCVKIDVEVASARKQLVSKAKPVPVVHRLGWRGKFIRFSKEPWVVIISLFWLASLSFTLSAYPISWQWTSGGVWFQSLETAAPNMIVAWICTGVLTFLLFTTIGSELVSTAYEEDERNPWQTPKISWSDLEP